MLGVVAGRSGSSLRELETLEAAEPALRLPKATIQEWYNRPGYINALAKLIAAKCDLYAGRVTVMGLQ